MAKKQAAKKAANKKTNVLKGFWQNNWVAILIVVILVGVLGFVSVNKMIINNQKKQFEQAEKSLDILYADITKNSAQPKEMTKAHSCSPSTKNTPSSDYYCSVGIVTTNSHPDGLRDAKALGATIFGTIKESTLVSSIGVERENLYDKVSRYTNDLYFKLNSSKLDCQANLEYEISKLESKIRISCSGDSNTNLYENL